MVNASTGSQVYTEGGEKNDYEPLQLAIPVPESRLLTDLAPLHHAQDLMPTRGKHVMKPWIPSPRLDKHCTCLAATGRGPTALAHPTIVALGIATCIRLYTFTTPAEGTSLSSMEGRPVLLLERSCGEPRDPGDPERLGGCNSCNGTSGWSPMGMALMRSYSNLETQTIGIRA